MRPASDTLIPARCTLVERRELYSFGEHRLQRLSRHASTPRRPRLGSGARRDRSTKIASSRSVQTLACSCSSLLGTIGGVLGVGALPGPRMHVDDVGGLLTLDPFYEASVGRSLQHLGEVFREPSVVVGTMVAE